MNLTTRNALLSGLGFYGVWVALILLLGDNSLYQLLLGVLAATAFGGMMYWLGQRRQSGNHNQG